MRDDHAARSPDIYKPLSQDFVIVLDKDSEVIL